MQLKKNNIEVYIVIHKQKYKMTIPNLWRRYILYSIYQITFPLIKVFELRKKLLSTFDLIESNFLVIIGLMIPNACSGWASTWKLWLQSIPHIEGTPKQEVNKFTRNCWRSLLGILQHLNLLCINCFLLIMSGVVSVYVRVLDIVRYQFISHDTDCFLVGTSENRLYKCATDVQVLAPGPACCGGWGWGSGMGFCALTALGRCRLQIRGLLSPYPPRNCLTEWFCHRNNQRYIQLVNNYFSSIYG